MHSAADLPDATLRTTNLLGCATSPAANTRGVRFVWWVFPNRPQAVRWIAGKPSSSLACSGICPVASSTASNCALSNSSSAAY